MPTQAGEPPKKMLILNILNILREHTDADNKLSATKIGELLDKEYMQQVDRKAIKRNLMNLLDYEHLNDFGYRVECSETTRVNKNGEEEIINSDWYLLRDITDAELRLLVDGLLFSKHIPYNQCKDLIKKLERLSGPAFETKVRHIRTMPEKMPENKELFWTIEVLDEAISKNKKVTFLYNDYGIDKKKHPRLNNDGTAKEYTVSPYQMAATNGRYYLICNYDPYAGISNFRVDRISAIRMSDERSKPMKEIEGMENGFDLPKHMAESIYMYSGDSVRVKFKAGKHIIGDIIDWFGMDVSILASSSTEVIATVTVNSDAMLYWSLQYGTNVEVLEPPGLRRRISEAADAIAAKYK